MILYNNMVVPKPSIFKVKGRSYDDNIYTFDIETVSLFKIEGEWQPFNYDLDSEYYKNVEKACCPYIWQFSINSTVYYGREFMDFENVLKWISDKNVTKYIYCHNLSYEMQFLCDIICKNKWHISGMVARNLRQPIAFHIDEINITFRCSYMLTNLSLAAAAEKYTSVKKAVGELDYNTAYSPVSDLPESVYHYCEMDCITLFEIIKAFKGEYGHIKSIPLTQTGEVRQSLRKYIDFYYIKKQWALVPDRTMYCLLMAAFQGGITHANMLHANRVIKGNIWSYDFCSSYPYCMVAYKFPSEPFFTVTLSEVERMKNNYVFIYDLTLVNVRATKHNHYLSYSKLTDVMDDPEPAGLYKKCVDNGRLVKCKECRIICTNYDLDCILQCYECDVIYNHIWASYAKYLDKRVIEFILDRYVAKTELKGVSENDTQFKYYMKMKQELNSVYG